MLWLIMRGLGVHKDGEGISRRAGSSEFMTRLPKSSKASPYSTTNWGPSVQIQGPIGGTLSYKTLH